MVRGPQIFQRLGSRERRLIGLMVAVLLIVGSIVGHVYLDSQIAEVEEALEEGDVAVEEIRLRAREYLGSMQVKKALEDAIKMNDPKIQTAIDSIAKKVDVTRLKGSEDENTSFDKVLRYEAKTTERPLTFGKKKKKRDKSSEFVELSQPTEYSFLKFIGLIRFLEQVESPERLMYVSKLVVTRKYMDPEYVQGQMTISTFIHKPQKEEEEE